MGEQDSCLEDRCLDDDFKISRWTWKGRISAFMLATCLSLGAGFFFYRCDDEVREDKVCTEHVERVGGAMSAYDPVEEADEPRQTLIFPGSTGEMVKNSVFIHGRQVDMEDITFQQNRKFENNSDVTYRRPFIRRSDQLQDIYFESDAVITGIDFSDLEGSVKYRTGIRIVPDIPDILPQYFRIEAVQINSKDIPLSYIEARHPDDKIGRLHYYVDIQRLVDDKVLSEADFEDSLEMKVHSGMEIGETGSLEDEDIAGVFAYKALPGNVRKHTLKGRRYPVDHPRIRKIVEEYNGSRDDVIAIVDYALQETIDALEYEVTDDDKDLMDVVRTGKGDCEYYSLLFVTILRSFGIPARSVHGKTSVSAGQKFGGLHEWSEVCIPFKDGSYRWVMVEPTRADDKADPSSYIDVEDDEDLYHAGFDIMLDTDNRDNRFYVFHRHRWVSTVDVDIDAPIGDMDDVPPLIYIDRSRSPDADDEEE